MLIMTFLPTINNIYYVKVDAVISQYTIAALIYFICRE